MILCEFDEEIPAHAAKSRKSESAQTTNSAFRAPRRPNASTLHPFTTAKPFYRKNNDKMGASQQELPQHLENGPPANTNPPFTLAPRMSAGLQAASCTSISTTNGLQTAECLSDEAGSGGGGGQGLRTKAEGDQGVGTA